MDRFFNRLERGVWRDAILSLDSLEVLQQPSVIQVQPIAHWSKKRPSVSGGEVNHVPRLSVQQVGHRFNCPQLKELIAVKL
jgi:hypothetical protein